MAFSKKTWTDRVAENIAGRTLTDDDTGVVSHVTVTLNEGKIYTQGDEINASNLNDLENRIDNAFNSLPPIIYSTDEREVGVWADGKPLYEKTIAITNEKFGDAMTLNTGVSDMENLVYSEWCITGNINVTPPVEASGTYIRCEHTGNGVLTIGISNKQFAANANRTWYLTIRYTKTTDQAGSGQWSPQGVPAQHYST